MKAYLHLLKARGKPNGVQDIEERVLQGFSFALPYVQRRQYLQETTGKEYSWRFIIEKKPDQTGTILSV